MQSLSPTVNMMESAVTSDSDEEYYTGEGQLFGKKNWKKSSDAIVNL